MDYAKNGLDQNKPASIGEVQEAVKTAFAQKRIENAESLYLSPISWSIEVFNTDGSTKLPDFKEIKDKIETYSMGIELLVAWV